MYKEVYLKGENLLMIGGGYWSAKIPIKTIPWPKAIGYAFVNMSLTAGPTMLWRKLWL